MLTADDCQKKYRSPYTQEARFMTLWDVPPELEIGTIPRRIYCNKDLVKPLENAFTNLIDRNFIDELRTWDGCFNIRTKRGASSMSLHSWGIAIDVNAAWNPFGRPPTLSSGFVRCFTEAGFDWGGYWKKPDGMHFQLARLP